MSPKSFLFFILQLVLSETWVSSPCIVYSSLIRVDWIFPSVPKQVSASLYSFILFPFSGTFLESGLPYIHLLHTQALFLPGKLSQLGTQQSAHAFPATSTWARSSNAFGKCQTCLGLSAHAQKAQSALSAPHSLAWTPSMTSKQSLLRCVHWAPLLLDSHCACLQNLAILHWEGWQSTAQCLWKQTTLHLKGIPKQEWSGAHQSCTGAACPLLQGKTQENWKAPPW